MRALLVSVVLGAASLPALKERAQTEWHKHQYEKACKDFQQLAWIDKKDAATHWLELSQCQVKLGKKKEAIASARQAAHGGDAPTRLIAYARLAKLGVHLDVPEIAKPDGKEPDAGDCKPLVEAECGKMVACRYVNETGGDTYEVGLAFAPDADKLDPQAVGSEDKSPEAWSDTEHGMAGFKVASFAEEKGGTLRHCNVVAANACNGRVGVVCDGKAAELLTKPDAGLR